MPKISATSAAPPLGQGVALASPETAARALTATPSADIVEIGGKQMHVVKQVTRTVLHQEDGVPFCVRFTGAAYTAREIAVSGPKKDPPRLAEIDNLETGAKQVLVMNKILEAELVRAYPDDGYVGKCFSILRGAHHDTDKRYKTYQIMEVAIA